MIARIGLPIEVPFQESLDDLAVEEVSVFGEPLLQGVNEHCSQRPTEPFMSWNVEARFLPLNNRSGQFVFSQFTKYEFLFCAADFQPGREFRRKFHDTVIKKWRTHFHRMRHAHAVALHQNVVRQIVFLVEPQKRSKRVRGSRQMIHLRQKPMERSREEYFQKRMFFVVVKSSIPKDMRMARRQ